MAQTFYGNGITPERLTIRRWGYLGVLASFCILFASCSIMCRPEDTNETINITSISADAYGNYKIKSQDRYGYPRTEFISDRTEVRLHETQSKNEGMYAIRNKVGNCICSHDVESIDVYVHKIKEMPSRSTSRFNSPSSYTDTEKEIAE
jgi:hypothetical protein